MWLGGRLKQRYNIPSESENKRERKGRASEKVRLRERERKTDGERERPMRVRPCVCVQLNIYVSTGVNPILDQVDVKGGEVGLYEKFSIQSSWFLSE